MNKVGYLNMRVWFDDIDLVHRCPDVKYGKCVDILPIDDIIEEITKNLFGAYLKPYFMEYYHLVRKGYFSLLEVE
jgi:transitional endoplasmic reticulum ATPase